MTVGEMLKLGRRIHWSCLAFPVEHDGLADLGRIAAAKGEAFTLADRRPRCPVSGCPSRIRYVDRSSMFPRSLDTVTDKDDAWWAFNETQRQAMAAAGYTMECGKWGKATGTPPADRR